jgi:uncharacterized protein YndB with AHSA1/START domain/DNA-binding transcriptional ArsR family regulator
MPEHEGVDAALLAALAEPNRLRIVELLNSAPRPVGEVALALQLRQPQVTKHLQTLERAGLVTMHPLGQRRIYSLEREPLRRLAGWLGTFRNDIPSEAVLAEYQAAIEREQALASEDRNWPAGRTVRVHRTLAAQPAVVWRYWTQSELIRRWWSPDHFTVVACDANPVVGGRLRVVIAEGDGSLHPAVGRYVALTRPRALAFELAPVGPNDTPLFFATYRVRMTAHGHSTKLGLTITLGEAVPAAAPAIAGLRPGWKQLLGKLARELDGGAPKPASRRRR